MSYTVYILQCADDTLYTGCTNNMVKRLLAHNEGKTGAKYTRARRPVRLFYREDVDSLSAGRKREAEIKRLTRAQKLTFFQK